MKKRKAKVKPILALDIAFNNTGWVVINKVNDKILDAGCFVTVQQKGKGVRVSFDDARRCAEIARQAYDVCCEHEVLAIVGEMPAGGGISSSAVKSMAYATAVFAVLAEIAELPCEWTDPGSVKIALCGKRGAKKHEMMAGACKKFGIKKESKTYFAKTKGKKKKQKRVKDTYTFKSGAKFPGGKFEHIADSLGAYLACKTGNLLKLI